MTGRVARLAAWLWVAAGAMPSIAGAQMVGPLLGGGSAEVGWLYQYIDRQVAKEQDERWYSGADVLVVGRLGVTESMTASIELSSGVGGADIDEPVYSVGGGLQTHIWAHGCFRATTGINYNLRLHVYGSSGGASDAVDQRLGWNALGEYRRPIKGNETVWWGGPILSHLIVEYQPPAAWGRFESVSIIGAVIGATAVFFDHLVVQASATWVDATEGAAFLAYRF